MGELVRWGDIAQLVYGKALRDYDGNDQRPVRVYGTNGPIGYADVSQSTGPRVIVGRKGAYRGVHLATGEFWVIDTAYYLEHNRCVDAVWAYYALLNTDINGLGSGSAIPSTAREDFYSLRVMLPSLCEQRSIAEILRALDGKIAANERIARTALALADSLFEQARSSSEERTTIGELAEQNIIEFGDGYRTKRSEHGKPGLRILRAGDVRDFQLLPTGGDYVSADYSRQIGGKASMPGDVVMTTKGTVGRVAVVGAHTEQVVYSPQICYFRVRDIASLGVGCLAAWFRSPDLTSQTASLMYKSDMAPYINLRDIRSLSMPVFDPSVQHRQSKLQSGLLDRFDACCVENESLARTRDELLPLLMSGKLSVKAAETVASEVL